MIKFILPLFVCFSLHAQIVINGATLNGASVGITNLPSSGGGSSGAWYSMTDSYVPDLSSTGQTSQNYQNQVTLPTGTVTKLRMMTGTGVTPPGKVKIALYDSSLNLVGITADYPEITTSADNTIYEITLTTPRSITSGTFYLVVEFPDSSSSIGFLSTSGSYWVGNQQTYSSFPTATVDQFAGPGAGTLAIGVFVQ